MNSLSTKSINRLKKKYNLHMGIRFGRGNVNLVSGESHVNMLWTESGKILYLCPNGKVYV